MNGWTLSVLWGWFVAPLFGIPNISIAAAIGLVLTIQLLIRVDYDEDRYKDKTVAELSDVVIGKALIGPFVTIGLGWIVKQFI